MAKCKQNTNKYKHLVYLIISLFMLLISYYPALFVYKIIWNIKIFKNKIIIKEIIINYKYFIYLTIVILIFLTNFFS